MNPKHCVCINNIVSEFNKFISGVPQHCVTHSFQLFLFLLLYKMEKAHNFADDSTSSRGLKVSMKTSKLAMNLEVETEVEIYKSMNFNE